jgi:hypothetical protein
MATARIAAPRAHDASPPRVWRAAASPAPWAALREKGVSTEEAWRRARAAAVDAAFLRDTAPTVLRVRASLPAAPPPAGAPAAAAVAAYALGALAASPPPARLGLRRRPLVVPFSSGAALTLALAGGPLPLCHVTLRLRLAAALPGAHALDVLKAAPAGEWDARQRVFTWRIGRLEANAPHTLLRLHVAARRGGQEAEEDAPSEALCAELTADVDTTTQNDEKGDADEADAAKRVHDAASASASFAPLSGLALAARLRDGREGCVRASATVRAAVFAADADARTAAARVTASAVMPMPAARAPAPAEQAPPAEDDAPPSSSSASSSSAASHHDDDAHNAPHADAADAVAADIHDAHAPPAALSAASSPTPSPSPSAPSSPASHRSHASHAADALSSSDDDDDSGDGDDDVSSDEEGELTSPPATPRSLGARDAAPRPSAGAPLPATALFDFDAAGDEDEEDGVADADAAAVAAREMSVRAGDALWVTSDVAEGWVMARNAHSGASGLVPAAYLAIEPN